MRRSHAEIGVTAAAAVLSFAATALSAPVPVTAVLAVAMLASLGYVWVTVLTGRRGPGLERVVVAAGLVLAVPVLGGLVLQAAGVPLHRTAWAGLLAGATIAGDLVLLLQGRAAPAAADGPDPVRRLPGGQAAMYGVAAVVAAAAVGLAVKGAAAQHEPGFTELWLVARGHGAAHASLGVSDRQGRAERYRLVLSRGGHVSDTWEVTLAEGQTWQRVIPVSAREVVRADLYLLPDVTHPYRHVETASDEGAG